MDPTPRTPCEILETNNPQQNCNQDWMTDYYTAKRERLNYARVLVQIQINQELKDEVIFENEKGDDVGQEIHYEWRPLQCQVCKMFGHAKLNCTKRNSTVQ